jgi:hypothetical protein
LRLKKRELTDFGHIYCYLSLYSAKEMLGMLGLVTINVTVLHSK